MLQDAVQQKVYAGIKVSQADIEKYFNNPANKSQFNVAESVDARHILVKTKAEADKVRALLEADNTRRELEEGRRAVLDRHRLQEQRRQPRQLPQGPHGQALRECGLRAQGRRDLRSRSSRSSATTSSRSPRRPRRSKQTLEQAKATIEQQLKYQKQSTAWEIWLKKAMAAAGVAYAAGFNPATLTASPSRGRVAFGLARAVRTTITRDAPPDEPHARVHRRRRRTGARSIAAGPLRRRRRLRPGGSGGRAQRARRRGRRPRLRPPARARPCRRRRARRPRPARRRRRDVVVALAGPGGPQLARELRAAGRLRRRRRPELVHRPGRPGVRRRPARPGAGLAQAHRRRAARGVPVGPRADAAGHRRLHRRRGPRAGRRDRRRRPATRSTASSATCCCRSCCSPSC